MNGFNFRLTDKKITKFGAANQQMQKAAQKLGKWFLNLSDIEIEEMTKVRF